MRTRLHSLHALTRTLSTHPPGLSLLSAATAAVSHSTQQVLWPPAHTHKEISPPPLACVLHTSQQQHLQGQQQHYNSQATSAATQHTCGSRQCSWVRHASTSSDDDSHRISPRDTSLNHFQLMDMPNMRFDMDTKKLDQRYKELQWRYHPDKASMRPVEEQEHAADHSTAVNRAYSVLRDPLTRATYMLAQMGINVDGEDAGTISDPVFLMEVMETREEVEQTSDITHLYQLQAKNIDKQHALFSKLNDCFERNDLAAAKEVATELIYVVKLGQTLNQKLP